MVDKQPFSMIHGIGKSVPERILTNHDLEKMVETSDEWIRSRTGIERRHIADKSIRTSDLCSEAARGALKEAGIDAKDLDMILVGTVSGDATFPSTACYVQQKIGAENASAMDLQAACSGFVYALSVADGFIATKKAKYVLVIGAEILTRLTNWEDRTTCVLFGDGAGAAVVGPADDSGRGIIDTYLKSDGRLTELLCMLGGGTTVPFQEAVDEGLMHIRMNGPEVFKAAVTAMGDAAQHILEKNDVSPDEIKLLIPHQANVRIIRATARRLKLPEEKVYTNVHEYGNTSAASIPIALNEAQNEGRLEKGDLIMLVAFGGGFTWGSALMRF